MSEDRKAFLLKNGESIEVSRDLMHRRVTFSIPGAPPFEMHIRQAYHLARFLAGAATELDYDSRQETDEEDTKPLRAIPDGLDLSETGDPE